jgi:hypothetical protein
MRSLLLVGVGAAGAASVFACTAILGDYTIGKGTDGGGDDSPTTDGGGGGDGGSDAPNDGPAPLKPLNCTLVAPKVTFTWTTVCSGASSCSAAQVGQGDRIYVYPLAQNGMFRLLITANSTLFYADFHDNDNTVALNSFPVGGGSGGYIVSTVRYPAGAQTSVGTGTAFLTVQQNAGVTSIATVLFPDANSVPVVGPTVIDASNWNLPSSLNNNQGTLEVLDATAGEFLVVFEYIDSTSTDYLLATHPKNGETPVVKLSSGANGSGGSQYAIAHDSSHAYVLWNPPSSSGPPSGPMPLYTLDLLTMNPQGSPRQLGPDSGFYQPFAFIGSPTTAGSTDLAFIQADLNQQTILPVLHAGQVKMTDLGTFDPGAVPGATLTLDQLTFNKGNARWSAYPTPTGDQFLTASRPINDGVPGMNFLWLDTQGRLRSAMSETDGAAGWPTTIVNTADAILVGTPALGFATVRIAWSEGQTSTQGPPVYSMAGNCLVAP